MKEMAFSVLNECDQYAGLGIRFAKKLAFTEDFKGGVVAYLEKWPQFKGK